MQLLEQRPAERHKLIGSFAEIAEHRQCHPQVVGNRRPSVQRSSTQRYRTPTLQDVGRVLPFTQHKLTLETLRELVDIALVGTLVADRRT